MPIPPATGLENVWWAVGTVAIVILGILVNRWTSNKQILHQVKNDHETNLRDDIDRVLSGIAAINTELVVVNREIASLKKSSAIHDVVDADIDDTYSREIASIKRELIKETTQRQLDLQKVRTDIQLIVNQVGQ